MPHAWEGIGKSPITLIKDELTRRFIQSREIEPNFVNYSIFVDVGEEEQDLTVGVLHRDSGLFFTVDLQIECPDDTEIRANVAEIAYDLYLREKPFYGRILITEESTYYQLCHLFGPRGILDDIMVATLIDQVQEEVLEVLDLHETEE
ncbi:MAG TPA: hypothetical protein PLI53_10475 [Geobacteraceae bacterium]|nr:hypothetical protein [Geobacteraceae bacterium]